MADAYRHGHEIGVQDWEPVWYAGDRPVRQSVALWLADQAGLPTVEYPTNDLFQPPSALVEFQPVAGGSRPATDTSERNA